MHSVYGVIPTQRPWDKPHVEAQRGQAGGDPRSLGLQLELSRALASQVLSISPVSQGCRKPFF